MGSCCGRAVPGGPENSAQVARPVSRCRRCPSSGGGECGEPTAEDAPGHASVSGVSASSQLWAVTAERRAQSTPRRKSGHRSGALQTRRCAVRARGVICERALTDNGSRYHSRRRAGAADGLEPPRRPARATSPHDPTGPRPTAKQNAATEPCSKNGPTTARERHSNNANTPAKASHNHRTHSALK